MLDNFGTAIVQALGFFLVFTFFVYQTLFADENSNSSQLKTRKKRPIETKESKESNKNIARRGIFNRKINSVDKNSQSKRKGLFTKKSEEIIQEIKPKKKNWFN